MITIFIASFCALVIEIIAGHVLAPFVGHSIFTWTCIIGVVLGALSLGNYLGGKVADSGPTKARLGLILIFSGGLSILIYPLSQFLHQWPTLLGIDTALPSYLGRSLLLSLVLFFLPAALLGMVSPIIARSLISDHRFSGRIIGTVSAVGTLGSIIGTFLTGFVLIVYFSVQKILTVIGLVLIVFGLFHFILASGGRSLKSGIFVLAFLTSVGGSFAFSKPPKKEGIIVEKDTAYSWIQVEESSSDNSGRKRRQLFSDLTFQAENDLDDPTYLVFDYLQIVALYLDERFPTEESKLYPLKFLAIGGGGYSFPRYIEKAFPNSTIDVVEVDPAVSEIAEKYMGFQTSGRTHSINADARWFAIGSSQKNYYDFILLDAYALNSIPYHLTSAEFFAQMKKLLKEDGTLFSNLIDKKTGSGFLISYLKTMMHVFGKETTGLVTLIEWFEDKRADNVILVTGAQGLKSIEPIFELEKLTNKGRPVLGSLTGKSIIDYASSGILITDNYNPSEYLSVMGMYF